MAGDLGDRRILLRVTGLSTKAKSAAIDLPFVNRKFAMNIGLKFSTPEEYFLGEPVAEYVLDHFDPRSALKLMNGTLLFAATRLRFHIHFL